MSDRPIAPELGPDFASPPDVAPESLQPPANYLARGVFSLPPGVRRFVAAVLATTEVATFAGTANAEPAKLSVTPIGVTEPAQEHALRKAPDVKGDTVKEARQEIQSAGFKYGGLFKFHPKKGVVYEASGLKQVQSFKTRKIKGHIERTPIFTNVRPGAKRDNKNPLFITMRPSRGTPQVIINIDPPIKPAKLPPNDTPPSPEPINNSEILTPEQLMQDRIEYAKKHTVRIPVAGNCTGTYLENEQGEAIGVISTRHCNVSNAISELAPGESTIKLPSQDGTLNVYGGDNHDQIIGKISYVIAAPSSDKANDTDVYVFEGVDPAELKKAFDKIMISPDEERIHLIPGDNSGVLVSYPVAEPNRPGNANGVVGQEVFTDMTFLGTIPINSGLDPNGAPIQMRVFGSTKSNPSRAISSAGGSGSSIIVSWQGPDNKIVYKIVGVQSGWEDFREDPGVNTIRDKQNNQPLIDPNYNPSVQKSFYGEGIKMPLDYFQRLIWTANFTFSNLNDTDTKVYRIILKN